jgi:hypothetical protein
VRPASHILEYFDPPQSRRTFAGVQAFGCILQTRRWRKADSNHQSLFIKLSG